MVFNGVMSTDKQASYLQSLRWDLAAKAAKEIDRAGGTPSIERRSVDCGCATCQAAVAHLYDLHKLGVYAACPEHLVEWITANLTADPFDQVQTQMRTNDWLHYRLWGQILIMREANPDLTNDDLKAYVPVFVDRLIESLTVDPADLTTAEAAAMIDLLK